MDHCAPGSRDAIERDLHAARAAIADATVDATTRQSQWGWWTQYAAECRIDPWLRHCSRVRKQQTLLAFAARVRTGFFGNKRQVGSQTVEKALRSVAQTLVLAGYDDPRRSYGSKELDLPFSHLLRSLKTDDPAPKPQVALPVATVEYAVAAATCAEATTRANAVGDLIAIAFYFLLRVGEYTFPQRNRKTRTVQFRVEDVRFWNGDQRLPSTASLPMLLQATSATLTIDNQKNGVRGATMHQEARPHEATMCPVKALARRVHFIRQRAMPESTPLSYLGPNDHVVSADILSAVRQATVATGLVAKGYKIDRVGSHSLRASGAMALKLNNVDTETIQKIGRWSGSTFLVYIHSQIGALNAGISERMSTRISFHNVGS